MKKKLQVYYLILLSIFLTSCKMAPFVAVNDPAQQGSGADSNETSAQSPGLKGDFCSGTHPLFWNRAEVQTQIKALLKVPGYSESGLSAYAEVYLKMTDQRDEARCLPSNPMYPKSAFSRAVGDRLSDIMTKSFVTHQRMCFAAIQGKSVSLSFGASEWCEYMKKSVAKKESALSFAMGSTAMYLSHTMPVALSAVLHDNSLWQETPFQTYESRVQALSEYRPTYDAFNGFLSSHMRMIVDVLTEQKRITCNIFTAAVSVAQQHPLAESIFKEIRDRSYQRGILMAKQWPLGFHPFLQGTSAINVERSFDATAFNNKAGTEDDIQFAISRLQNPYLKFFNGKDAKSYLSDRGLFCGVQR